MKRIAYIIGVFTLAAFVGVSCQKEDTGVIDDANGQEVPEEVTPEVPSVKSFTFTIGESEETKMVIAEDLESGKKYGNWESGDRIGFSTNNASGDKGFATVVLGTPPTFTITPEHGIAADNTIGIWYPYGTDQASPSAVELEIPTEQTQDASAGFDFDAMPMVAEPITVTTEMATAGSYSGNIQFANLGSVICFKVYATSSDIYDNEQVKKVTLTTGTALAGTFTKDMTAIDFTDEDSFEITGLTDKSVTTTLSAAASFGSTKGTAKDIYMVVAPGTYSGTVVVDTDKAHYVFNLSDKDFARSGLKSFGLNLSGGTATRHEAVLLPWYFEGGSKSGLESTIGVRTGGLGADYTSHSPYMIRFDTSDDYIDVKTDKAIRLIQVGYKKIGGSDDSSITIKESSDGSVYTDVQTFTVKGAANAIGSIKTTNDFASTSRYVRIIFTKAANVGIGPIIIRATDDAKYDYYRLITDTDEFSAGEYVVGALCTSEVSDKFYFAKASTVKDGSNYDWAEETTGLTVIESYGERKFLIEDLPAGADVFTLTGNNTSGFTISNGGNYLYYTAATNRRLAFGATGSTYKWIVAAKSKTPVLRGGVVLNAVTGDSSNYTISENSSAFGTIRGYASTTQYNAIYLFKKVNE